MTNQIVIGSMGLLAGLVVGLLAASNAHAQSTATGVKLNWLDTPPGVATGVSWGVPWPRGAVKPGQNFAVRTADGKSLPLQTWPLAYWPDGSLKWTGNAIFASSDLAGPLTIAPVDSAVAPEHAITVNQNDDHIEINTGPMTCRIAKKGSALIESIALGDKLVGANGKLVCIREDRSDYDANHTTRAENFSSRVDSVTLEQDGPVRAVVKIQGMHQADASENGRAWLPFIVRLYFFAGSDSIKMVHTFIYDGDQDKDFIKALGVRFEVPMRLEAHNRQVRFAGESDAGMFAEPLRPIVGRRNPGQDLYRKQIAGQQLPNLDQLPGHDLIQQLAVWDAYRLIQMSPESFAIQKRTNPKSAWVDVQAGGRAMGLAFIGDASGGLAIGLKNFWQTAPTELEIEKASTGAAELTLWLWSPDSPTGAMDMRHYDVVAHGLDASYEDVQPGFSSATGVARTNEILIQAFDNTPSNEHLVKLAKANADTPRLVCSPEYYHSIPVFGVWSLPDRSTPGKKWIEDQLDAAIAFYQGQIEQRHWYGFWNFGDVMHSYDAARHEWKYDMGGFAWDNTELGTDMWLWYSFLRTGRADIFKMAEAMTRHTQEVDCYHLGRFAGLGSRHNVRHWGDGAKEARISQAPLKRFYYYLTTDERVGDLMNEVINTDYQTVAIDPLREIEKPTTYPTHTRIGPDWFAFCGNWMAAWERTGDTKYRDKIITGMKSIAAMPHKLFSGDSCGYDPKTGMLYQIHDNVFIPHLAALMGGPEVMMELTPLIDLPEWNDAWMNYCEYLQAPREEQVKAIGGAISYARGPDYTRLTAYAAHVNKDPKLAERAWQEFLRQPRFLRPQSGLFASHKLTGPDVPVPVDEIPFVSTNNTSQWSLNAIELLQLIGDQMPKDDPAWQTK